MVMCYIAREYFANAFSISTVMMLVTVLLRVIIAMLPMVDMSDL